MTISREFKRTSILRRAAAAFIDLILAFILFIMLLVFIVSPCFENFSDYGNKYQSYINMCLDSKLYFDNGGEISDLYGENYIKKDEALTYFYNNYSSIDKLNEEKAKREDLFTYVDGGYVYAKNKDVELTAFYNEEYQKAISIFEEQEEIKNILTILSTHQFLIIAISLFVALVLILYIPPIIFKKGRTIGKVWLHIELVSKKTGDKIHWAQWVFRTSIYFVVEILLSLYSFLIPLLINALFTIFNKSHLGIHDVLCSTVPIDASVYDSTKLREVDKIIITYEYNDEVKENG